LNLADRKFLANLDASDRNIGAIQIRYGAGNRGLPVVIKLASA